MTLLQKTMKVVKDYFFILALVATFVGFSAFRISEEIKALPEQNLDGDWFEYDEAKGHENGPLNPDNYNYLSSGTPPNDCAPGHQICAINAPNNSGQPDIDEDLEADIEQAMEDGEPIAGRVLVRL